MRQDVYLMGTSSSIVSGHKATCHLLSPKGAFQNAAIKLHPILFQSHKGRYGM